MSDKTIKDLLDFTRSINGIDLTYYVCNKIDENLILYNIFKNMDTDYKISVSYFDDNKLTIDVTDINPDSCNINQIFDAYDKIIKIESQVTSDNSVTMNMYRV